MYKIELSDVGSKRETIKKIRKEINQNIGLAKNSSAIEPLNFASYLFGYTCNQKEPVGLIEFFLYDQAFSSYDNAPYSQATDLTKIVPMAQMGHIRSVFLKKNYRRSKLFLLLLATTVKVASQMGAHYMTAGTGIHNTEILHLHKRAGMKFLGQYMVDDSLQQLSLLELDPLLNRANKITDKYLVDIDLKLINSLRNLKFK